MDSSPSLRRLSRAFVAAFLVCACSGAQAQLQVDPAVNYAFRTSARAYLSDVAELPSGRLVICGSFDYVDGLTAAGRSLVVLGGDGRLDPAFVAPESDGQYSQVEALSDGKILAAGFFSMLDGQPRPGLVRLLPNGAVDPSFVPAAPDTGYYIANLLRTPDDGFFTSGITFGANGIATVLRKYNSDGQFDAGYPFITIDGYATAMAAGPSGELAVVVPASNYYDTLVHVISSTGASSVHLVQPPFRPFGVCFDADGAIVMCGQTYPVGPSVVRIMTDGNVDSTFSGMSSVPNWSGAGIVSMPGGGYAVTGVVAGDDRTRVIQHFTRDGQAAGTITVTFHGAVTGLDLRASPSNGYSAFGAVVTANGLPRPSIVKVSDAGAIEDFVADVTARGIVSSVVPIGADGTLLAGSFTEISDGFAGNIAVLSSTDQLNTTLPVVAPGVDNAFATQDGGVVLMGGFPALPGTRSNGIAKLNSLGQSDPTFLNEEYVFGFKTAATLPDGSLVLAGSLGSSTGPLSSHVVQVLANGAINPYFTGPALTSVTGSPGVYAMDSDRTGRIAIAGQFGTVNGLARPGIAVIDAAGGTDLSFAPDIGLEDAPQATSLTFLDDGRIYVIGKVPTDPGYARRLVRFTAGGSLDPLFSPEFDATAVTAYLLNPDGSLLVAVSDSATQDGRIVHVAESGAIIQDPMVTHQGGAVQTIFKDAQGRLWIGGSFTGINGVPHEGLVRLVNPALTVRIAGPGEILLPRLGSVVLRSEVANVSGQVRYQWNLNGCPIPLARNPSLLVVGLQPLDGAKLTVTVRDTRGSATSAPVTIRVVKRRR